MSKTDLGGRNRHTVHILASGALKLPGGIRGDLVAEARAGAIRRRNESTRSIQHGRHHASQVGWQRSP